MKAIATKREWIETIKLSVKLSLLITFLFTGSVALVGGTRAALAASLKSSGIITGDYIKLGDVFDGVKNAEYILGPAPAPGQDMILNARTLYKIASALDVQWSPSTASEQLVLRREASIIPQTEITVKLEDALRENGVKEKFSITYLSGPSDMVLPAGTPSTMDITAFNFDPTRDSFNAIVVAPSADNPLKRVSVSGRIERLTAVPVLKNTLKNGDIISALDIDWIDLPQNRIANGTLMNERDLINMTPRRVASAGKPVNSNELEHPKMVGRGEDVTLVFANGGMMLSVKGKAMQDGAMGDSIRVSNTGSNKNLTGIVTAHREVTIR
jgi:flagella basal body P-ring formation protein FlgA